jgi:DNA-binding MarR family transcriptional regulator
METMIEKEDKQAEQYAAELLELFYPIHYRGNMAVEDAMRGKLTRKEAAIIWLIRSAGEDGIEMRRKEIVARLQDWFDVSSPAVTKALRHMARPPLSLVRLVEDAASGREKRVRLTSQGQRFVLGMITRGQDFLRKVVEQLPDQQVLMARVSPQGCAQQLTCTTECWCQSTAQSGWMMIRLLRIRGRPSDSFPPGRRHTQ